MKSRLALARDWGEGSMESDFEWIQDFFLGK